MDCRITWPTRNMGKQWCRTMQDPTGSSGPMQSPPPLGTVVRRRRLGYCSSLWLTLWWSLLIVTPQRWASFPDTPPQSQSEMRFYINIHKLFRVFCIHILRGYSFVYLWCMLHNIMSLHANILLILCCKNNYCSRMHYYYAPQPSAVQWTGKNQAAKFLLWKISIPNGWINAVQQELTSTKFQQIMHSNSAKHPDNNMQKPI